MKKKELDKKLLEFLDGEQISETEKTEITAWIESNRENKTYAELIEKISEEKRFLDQLKRIDTDKNWERFQDSLRRNTPVTSGFSLVQRKGLYLSRIAAAVLLLILAGTTLYFAKRREAYHVQLVNSINENTEVRLSDGSTIVLNKGSVLTYPVHLKRRKREVKLKGEAYFEVAEKNASPFYVYLKNTTVRVLGTSFNIKEQEDKLVEVHVLTGKVSFFETKRESNSIKLEAGQKGIFKINTGEFEQSKFNSENFLFWKTGSLSFVNQRLDIVFKDLEKYFGTTIITKDNRILQNRLTSYCEGQELDDILNELSILFNLDFYKKGDTVYIQKSHK
jgi:ferric-dicitrate binding protein FerR (iron transport regulator)